MSLAHKIDVEIRAPVYPTEVPDRVVDAIEHLFPGAEIERREGEIVARTHSLERFKERIKEQRILDTARATLFEHRSGRTLTFALKKQAAFEGVLNFHVGSSDELGELNVVVYIEDPDPETFIEYLAPESPERAQADES